MLSAFNAFDAYALDGQKPFAYYAENQEITTVLSAFAGHHNLTPNFSSQVTGSISGKFENIPSADFLESMKQAFGIDWFELADVLYFYNQAEIQKTFISSKVIPAQELVSMLKASSIVSSNLPIKVMSQDMLVLSGPPTYLAQVQSAIHAFESAQISNFTMEVFPLKYAWADDITVTSMDTQITIPGVATILQAMVTGSNITATQVTQLPSAVDPLLGQGLSSVGAPQPVASTSSPTQSQAQQAIANPVSIIADPRVNSVIITDAAYRMNYYKKVIEDLDKPVELVEIHAAIVDIDSDYNRNLGISFQGGAELGNDTSMSGSSGTAGITPPTQTPGSILSSGLSLSTLYSSGVDFFLAQVEALEEDNNARILGKPSVLTMDNIQATLENTSTYYIQVAGTDVADLFKVESGTILKVTPHIINNSDGKQSIKLVVNVQDDQGDDSSSTAVGALPPIKQTKINTQAIVNEGQSLLIGGYYYEQASDGDSGIPGLKNIPLLGNLFKSSSKVTKKMERLILITPRIVSLDEKYEVPERVNVEEFSRDATQADYKERVPQVKTGSGCSKSPQPENP